MKRTGIKQWVKKAALTGAFVLPATARIFAEGPAKPSELDNPLAVMLLVVAGALLIAIFMLGSVLINMAELHAEKVKKQRNVSSAVEKTLLIAALCFISSFSFAKDGTDAQPVQAAVATTIGGLSSFTFYALVTVIFLELLVITAMLRFLKSFMAKERVITIAELQQPSEPFLKKWWAKLNSFKPAHEEVDLGHDYDGIRELDNRLPPWWLYGFYITIVFACVYLYRAHVSHAAPSSEQEYQLAVANAEIEKESYLKNAANKVDENSITLLTDATSLDAGKKIFVSTCAACHGPEGQGVVGPNLTDDYWLHKGGLKDIFKTIKYGVPEKGMKSWEADFSPVQLAQIASYIKSLHGTKPANPKEPQGDLYKEEAPAPAPDSAKIVAAKAVEK